MKKTTFLTTILGFVGGVFLGTIIRKSNIQEPSEKIEKFKGYYNLLNQWLMIKQQGQNIEEYFTKHNYHKIAIYGMGEIGNRLYDELKDTHITVDCVVDQCNNITGVDLPIYTLNEIDKLEVDAIVVTPIFAFDSISKSLSIGGYKGVVISLEEVMYGM